MSAKRLPPRISPTVHAPTEVTLTFYVDGGTDLTGFVKAGLEALFVLWDSTQQALDGAE